MNSFRQGLCFALCCLICFSITSIAQYKIACTCLDSINSPSNEFGWSSSVFSGRVLSMTVDTASSLFPLMVTFQVNQTWKGTPSSLLTISTGLSSASCGVAFHLDSTYLVYAYQWQAKLSTDICRRTRLLSKAAEDLTFLTTVSIDRGSEVSELPTSPRLFQNYPNPFNPSTTIAYSLLKSAIVSLGIFNTLGQEVAVLVNERKSAGIYQVQWSANVPSGIYFYRLQARQTDGGQAGEFVETKKMILIR